MRSFWYQKCALLTDKEFHLMNMNSSMPYFCYRCCFDIFPFQTVSNKDLNFDILNDKICPLGINFSLKDLDCIPQNKQYIGINNVKDLYKKSFNVLYLNIRSLNANFDKLNEMITCMKIKPDIIGVSETWLTTNRPFIHNLQGYNFIYEHFPSNSGGVGFFLNYHKFVIKKEYRLNVENCEDSWIEIDLPGNKSLVVGVIYRHPKRCFLDFQEKIINTVQKSVPTEFKSYTYNNFKSKYNKHLAQSYKFS